jgi:hypothetical protein
MVYQGSGDSQESQGLKETLARMESRGKWDLQDPRDTRELRETLDHWEAQDQEDREEKLGP